MDFRLSDEQEQIKSAIERLCEPFDDEYWFNRDRKGASRTNSTRRWRRPAGWHRHAASLRRRGLGISDAALMMHTIAATGADCRAPRPCT